MHTSFTLEYWEDDSWFVGRLKEIPQVMSQGESLEELQENIRDAYALMRDDAASGVPIPDGHHEVEMAL